MSLRRPFRMFFGRRKAGAENEELKPRDEHALLLDLYKISLDEYRFQVNLNWSRTQYYIILNLGILGLATGLLRLENQTLAGAVGTGLYFAGVVCCILALAAGHVQRTYYRQTKKHKAFLEGLLELDDLAVQTTPGMGNKTKRLAKVATFHNVILFILLVLDVVGLSYSCWQLLPTVTERVTTIIG